MKRNIGCPSGNVMAILRLMKLITLFIFAGLIQVHASALSQTVTLSGHNLTLKNVLESVEKQTDFVVFGNKVLLKQARPVTVSVTNMPLESFLKRIFDHQPIGFELGDKHIIISKKTGVTSVSTEVISKQETINIRGRIVDKNNVPLTSANIRLKNSKEHTVTDSNGFFSLNNIERSAIVSISLVGYGKIDIPVSQFVDIAVGASVTYQTTKISKTGKNDYSFQLQPETISIDEVVITGIVERKKESFTGATSSFTGTELLKVGNTNVLQSLKTLDPSFIMVDNVQFGSDPNRLANIEVRGRSSFSAEELKNTFETNPNLPLFILDGFESDLRTITDLNIHRIARITLLKDAASTALYGSRAANGVVVVETKQPKPGKIEINYSTDLTINAPFLNDYNLMNAAEKLEFERLSGQFTGGFLNTAMMLEADYYRRLSDVKSGVDTYWLSEPLRTGFSNGHNVNLSGGSNELRFNAGVSYKTDQGVMKGSGRDTWRGSLALTYRKDKLNITNQLFVNGYDSKESPYGTFSDFASATPYYRKTDAFGNPQRYLNIFADPKLALGLANDSIPNPLYVARIGNRNNSKSFGFTNNLQANYDLTSDIRLSGAFSITRNNVDNVVFRPSENPEFDNKLVEEKGLYRKRTTESSAYQGSIMLTYAKVFNEIHQLTANVRAEVQENKLNAVGFSATGFATMSNGNPNLASGYTPYGRPTGDVLVSRRNNLLASVNYALNSKYLVDFGYRYDGSTAFGSAKRYSPFWSTGIGWNIHNEKAIEAWDTFNLLKLRASIGYTGNQQFDQILSANVYQQLAGQNLFGEMADLLSLGNPNLEWQRTQNLSLGLDFGLLESRLNGYVNLYRNRSSPLIVPIAQAPSSGVASYNENVGMLTYKGIEFQSVYSVVYRPADRFVWNVSLTMAHNEGIYSGFEGKLRNLNQAQRDANSYTRFFDGNRPEDIWAVRSAGIDPLTGKELFIKKDGSLTFEYDANDETVLGNTRPKLEGVLGTNVNYKGFSAGVYLRYSYKADILNTALYNKVENLSGSFIRTNNLDKRALYDRWKKEGDISAFKSITDNSFTPISSRFIQTESFISGESITMGYRFTQAKWLKQMGLQDLNIAAFTNNIFRSSTIRNERGIDYPFASSVSININATF